MNIIGKTIILQAIEEKDNDLLQELINNPEIEYYTGGWSFPVSKEKQYDWYINQKNSLATLRLMIYSIYHQINIGTIILNDIDFKNGTCEIHIKIHEKYTRQGFAKESISLLTNYCFQELRLNCIISRILEYNLSSVNLFEQCGFTLDGKLKSRIFKGGNFHDVLEYSLIKDK